LKSLLICLGRRGRLLVEDELPRLAEDMHRHGNVVAAEAAVVSELALLLERSLQIDLEKSERLVVSVGCVLEHACGDATKSKCFDGLALSHDFLLVDEWGK